MIHGLTFKEYIEEEKLKFSEMTKDEKVEYFKDYYLKPCIVGVVVFALLVWLILDLTLNMKNSVVTGGVVNLELSEEGSEYLGDKYLEYLELSSRKNRADLAPDIFLDREEPQTFTLFQAELATNTYNYLITDEKGLDFVADIECLADLDKTLDPDLSQKLTDKKIYRKSGESDTEIAAAIDITDTAFTKDYIRTGERVYFVISGKEEDYSSGLKVLSYILSTK